ncbi:MAG: ABC transporter ATP-binding protein [Desulfobacterales bacterium]|nr:ABC transporter ATP-binding protein [Desulfobacterales bacterium]
MHHDSGHFEEDALGKTHDTRLLRRLLPFARPFAPLFAWAALLVVLITGLDLALPYVTKMAVDRYIVPTSSPVTSKADTPRLQRQITADAEDPRVAAVARRYPGIVTRSGDRVTIAQTDLHRLTPKDIATLRRADLAGVAVMAAWFVGIVVINFILNFIQVIVLETAGQRIMHDLRLRLYTHIQSLSLNYFTRHPVGRLVTRVTNDVQNMNELFTSVVHFLFKDLFLLLGITVVLCSISWRLTLVSFAVLPLVAWASVIFARKSRNAFRTLRIKVAEINTRFSETIGGIRIIQLFGQETPNARRFARLNHENYMAGMTQIHVFAVFMPIIEVLAAITLAVIIFHGGLGVAAGQISLGALVAFISYTRMFFRPIRDIAEKYNVMQNAMASAERIFQVLDTREAGRQPVVAGTAAAMSPPPALTVGDIRFDDVTFAYPGHPPVFEHLDIAVAKGETVALVGPTGAGKSSLIHLVAGFFRPTQGNIQINGVDATTIDPATLRAVTALVMQEPFIFSDTLRANITMGKEGISEPEMADILAAARCQDIVERLPQGLETILAEGGKTLSSGERQLITIARAFARNPQLILLDEATSHIDSGTEKRIQAALAELLADRTAFIVAHRLSTIRHAHRILVLNRGRIIESGTHEGLMKSRGFYYNYQQIRG